MIATMLCVSILISLFFLSVYGHLTGEEEEEFIPTVSKCCPPGESFDKNLSCQKSNITFTPEFSKAPGSTASQKMKIVYYGDKCKYDSIKLEQGVYADEYVHLLDGNIYVPNYNPSMYTPDEFCMENFMNEDDSVSLSPLLCYPPVSINPWELSSVIRCLLTVPLFVVTALVYLTIRELRNGEGLPLSCVVMSLAVIYTVDPYLELWGEDIPTEYSRLIAFGMEFVFIASFSWMNVLCFYICTITLYGRGLKLRNLFLYYSLYGWGVPCCILAFSDILRKSDSIPSLYITSNFAREEYLLNRDKYILPCVNESISGLLAVNIGLWLLTMILRIFISPQAESPSSSETPMTVFGINLRCFQCLLMFCMTGLNWTIEELSCYIEIPGTQIELQTASDMFTSCQGILVFAIYVVLDQRIWKLLTGKRHILRKMDIELDVTEDV